MGGAVAGYFFLGLLAFVIIVVIGGIFVSTGLLSVCVRPDHLRPPWWDWGMDDPKPAAKVEVVSEVEVVPTETPEVVTSKAAEPGVPRW